MMMLAPVLTPHGLLTLRQANDGLALEPDRGARIERAFIRGSGHGLLCLGADEVGTTLPPELSYWREFGARYERRPSLSASQIFGGPSGCNCTDRRCTRPSASVPIASRRRFRDPK